ncbi:nucleotidyltransferase domain-containing protein [Bradyrhizobium lablabi]|uniref:nucleotidyltransferase domain-containing protein n=1 Tax=Bradyrhizobium lablabi TaxID=722472 RepID=UPI001BAB22DE|nr:nucleotidyltransferase domain-containing protein [Bradyrhizobium lablabi]MBR1125204.1 nucleotidyltransferase domain-containing protein [Bradyrhizobium lablabi]
MQADPLLERVVAALAKVPGVTAIVLGGSRARGTAHVASDYDIGLYYRTSDPLDTRRLLEAAKGLADDAADTTVTSVGEWGRWIVGGAWLSIEGRKVDLLYRNIDEVAQVIEACRSGQITMDYQPGHPHGFCSAIWAGEAALCRPLHDPQGAVAGLKSLALPYPPPLREALVRRFQWEIAFSIGNAELGAVRLDQTHVAGCVYRALACIAQVLFALNERYLINEKGALREAAKLAQTLPELMERVDDVWQFVGDGDFETAVAILRELQQELETLA